MSALRTNEYDLIIVDSTDPVWTGRGAVYPGILRELL